MTISLRTRSRTLAWGALALAGCTVVPPTSQGPGLNRDPGRPFRENVCFRCTLQACAVATRACGYDAPCNTWLECIGDCPTDDSGVAVEADCRDDCRAPLSAGVLFDCIQDYSIGALSGCELACKP